MEVKEAIKHLKESAKVNFDEGFYEYHDKEKEIIALLKSLQAENKGYETVYKRALLENEKLKKENEAYKGMWRRLYEEIGNHGWELRDQDGFEIMTKIIKELEQTYLGGGE